MARLSCHCLNVAVHCKDALSNCERVDSEKLFPANSDHRLRGATLYEITLDIAGITTEQSAVMVTRCVYDWCIHMCSNCGRDVYVTHREKDRVFVCDGLLSREEDIKKVKSHPHYSTVFRMTLDPNLEEKDIIGRRRSSSLASREDIAMRKAHQQVKSYLARVEEEMKARVQAYERREREAYAHLQLKAQRDRILLSAAMAKARNSVMSEAVSDQSELPSPFSSSSITYSTSLPSSSHQLPKEKVTITLRNPHPAVAKPPLDDALFPLDGFEYEGEEEVDGGKGGLAFPQSDDEEISTDDSSYRDLSSVGPTVSSSVPLPVPVFQSKETATSMDEEVDHTDMANSIKALALSVQDTGMFGDLPRPRVNSDS